MTTDADRALLESVIKNSVELDHDGYYIPDRVLQQGSVAACFAGMRLGTIARELDIPTNVRWDDGVSCIRLENSASKSADVVQLDSRR